MFINAYMSGFPVDLNSPFQFVSGDTMPALLQQVAATSIDDMEHPEAVYYRPAMLMNYLYLMNTDYTVLKTHHCNTDVDGIPLCPERLTKGALYIVRDPRDVAVSYAAHLGKSIDNTIADMISNETFAGYHVLTSWSHHVATWTEQRRSYPSLIVRYEDMLAEPGTAFRAILDALGITCAEDRLEYAIRETRFEALQAKEQETGFVEKCGGDAFFRSGQAGAWQNVLTTPQVRKIESAFRTTMQTWGYKLAG
jgi:hypothetical protein